MRGQTWWFTHQTNTQTNMIFFFLFIFFLWNNLLRCRSWSIYAYEIYQIKHFEKFSKSISILKVISQMIWIKKRAHKTNLHTTKKSWKRTTQNVTPPREDWQLWDPIETLQPFQCGQSQSGSRQSAVLAAGVRNYDARLRMEIST